MPKAGYVYVATDREKPGHCKVGQTIDVERRARTLNGGKMEATIEIAGSVQVDDMDTVEDAFHKILRHRHSKGEWFNIEKDDVLPMLECIAKPAELATRFEEGPTDRVGERGGWHEAGWRMHCRGKTQVEIAEKFGVSQSAVVAMKKKMRNAGRGTEEKNGLRRSVPEQVSKEGQRRSDTTPQSAYREPLVDVLKELGGKGRAKDVIERVGRRLQGKLSPADYKRYKNGQIVWAERVQWERVALKKKGILKSNSRRGLWELA